MLKFSIAINAVFEEYDIYDRVKLVADAGYDGIDLYRDRTGVDPIRLKEAADSCGIQVVSTALNDTFEQTFARPYKQIKPYWDEAFEFAKACGAKALVGFGGVKMSPRDEPKNLIIENLKRIEPDARANGIVILLEALNNVYEHQHVYLNSSVLTFEILKCVDSPYCKMAYDTFHMQATEGNILYNLLPNLDYLGHLHCVGMPFHHEPFYSEVNHPYVLRELEKAGYDGFVCAEYHPTYDHFRSVRDVLEYLHTCHEEPKYPNVRKDLDFSQNKPVQNG